jgi:type IV pilus assembly protein PilW
MKNTLTPRAPGFTIIELMVGMVIALLATIVIFQVFEVSERHKRNTTSGSDAIQTGNFTLYQLEHQLTWAGAGLARMPNMWGCLIQATYNGTQRLPLTTALAAPFDVLGTQIRLAPALIRDGGGTAADVIVSMAGTNDTVNTPLQATTAPTISTVEFRNTIGIKQNDLLLAVEQETAGNPCRIAQVVAAAGPVVAPAVVGLVPNPIPLTPGTATSFTPTAAFNGFSASTKVANLGPAPTLADPNRGPQFFAFGIGTATGNPNLLLAYNFLDVTGQPLVPIADNVVNLQAIYGIAATPTSVPIAQWVPPTGAWDWSVLTNGSAASTDLIARIRAIRVAVVARSAEWDKDDVSPAAWTLFGDAVAVAAGATVSGTLSSAERKYRYKVFDTTIPMRNLLLANN